MNKIKSIQVNDFNVIEIVSFEDYSEYKRKQLLIPDGVIDVDFTVYAKGIDIIEDKYNKWFRVEFFSGDIQDFNSNAVKSISYDQQK